MKRLTSFRNFVDFHLLDLRPEVIGDPTFHDGSGDATGDPTAIFEPSGGDLASLHLVSLPAEGRVALILDVHAQPRYS
jgi:hypothetical protein